MAGRPLTGATASSEAAFQDLVEVHRADIHAHCYRMLGSLHDADDALQETLLRAWRALAGFRRRSALRTWLYRIATNVCLDALARRPDRAPPLDDSPPPWMEPYPDDVIGAAADAPDARYEQREAIEVAFIAALQHLPPRQRAALILRDVLDFSAKEAAEGLDTTVPSINGALARARKAVEERLPRRSQQATLRTLGDARVSELVERFIAAFERGDVEAILDMLADDATFAMPPYDGWYRGRDAIGDSWLMPGGPAPRLRYVETGANGQPAVGTYLLDRESERYLPIALDVLALDGGDESLEIADVTAFRTPALFPRFGLPDAVPA